MARDTKQESEAPKTGIEQDAAAPEPKGRPRRRRKVSYLTINKIDQVDYKDLNILRRFVNDRGKMLSSRQTGNTAKQQRMVARAVRRARELALLPYVVTDFLLERKDIVAKGGRPRSGGRRDYRREQSPEGAE
jgi:small subunit ribosomal protein S18